MTVGFQSLGLGGVPPPTAEPKIRNRLEPWNPGTLESPGTLEPWNLGTLKPWNPETWNRGILKKAPESFATKVDICGIFDMLKHVCQIILAVLVQSLNGRMLR